MSDSSLKNIFMLLAKDELNHAEILQKKSNNIAFELNHNPILSDTKNLFEGIKGFKSETKQIPEQLDLYRVALEKEKESIDLYEKLLLEVTDDESKSLYTFLLEEEKNHFFNT
jgi:rubrerythrin